MEFTQILYSKENRIATLTLNRPAKLNAYSEIMVHEILTALAEARDERGKARSFVKQGINPARHRRAALLVRGIAIARCLIRAYVVVLL